MHLTLLRLGLWEQHICSWSMCRGHPIPASDVGA
jgi:hypothetical protein